MNSSLAQFLILIVIGTVAPAAMCAESASSINLGLGGLNPMPHCNARVYTIEYEHPLTPTLAVLGRGSGVNYRYDDGQYLEDGRLRGMDVGTRYYPAGDMRGFFLGGGIGYWKGNWTFVQNQSKPTEWRGKGDANSLRLNINVGDRIPIRGTNVSIIPEVNLGKFFASSACEYTAPASRVGTPCNQKSEVNFYLFVGMVVGVEF